MRCNCAVKIMIYVFWLFFSSAALAANGLDALVSYRAVYDLQFDNASEKAGMTGLSGRMVYEFNGNKCDGYTTQVRSAVRFEVEGIVSRLVDQQSTSFETADGKEFHFASKNYVDEKLSEETNGVARQRSRGIEVQSGKSAADSYQLEHGIFPLHYTLQMLENAKKGKAFDRLALYDGTDGADRLVETVLVVGAAKTPGEDGEAKIMGELAEKKVWPVTVSYFNDSENKDGLPVYRTSFLLYKNGITRDLFMDYGDFSMRGKLVKLEILDNMAGKNIVCP